MLIFICTFLCIIVFSMVLRLLICQWVIFNLHYCNMNTTYWYDIYTHCNDISISPMISCLVRVSVFFGNIVHICLLFITSWYACFIKLFVCHSLRAKYYCWWQYFILYCWMVLYALFSIRAIAIFLQLSFVIVWIIILYNNTELINQNKSS